MALCTKRLPPPIRAAFVSPHCVSGRRKNPECFAHGLVTSRQRWAVHASNHSRATIARMASDPPQHGSDSHNMKQKDFESYLSPEMAIQAQEDAISMAGYDVLAVADVCAIGFVEAFMQCYNVDDIHSVFIVCGSGFNGLVGLQSAIKLKEKGYDPAVHFSHPSKYVDIPSVCSKNDIPLYEFVPSTLEYYFQVIVDAMLGVGFDGGDIHPPYWQVFEMLVSTRRPIASIDIPSGWDLTIGPRQIDRTADTFIKPELLVSLGAPKLCSKVFAGGYHFIAGRHLPEQYFESMGISVPSFPGDSHSVLFSSSPIHTWANGEEYGRSGTFNATLFKKNPRRRWVDLDDDMDLWDELD